MVQEIITFLIIGAAVTVAVLKIKTQIQHKKTFRKLQNQ